MDVELSVNMSSPGMGEPHLMGPGGMTIGYLMPTFCRESMKNGWMTIPFTSFVISQQVFQVYVGDKTDLPSGYYIRAAVLTRT